MALYEVDCTTPMRAKWKRMRTVLLTLCSILLVSCTSVQPEIGFIGVGSGTVQTHTQDIVFSEEFPAGIQSVTAAIQFTAIEDGTHIMASWFSPDERRPPFGRRTITIQSGATVARFDLGNHEGFPPGQYLLRIDARTEGEDPKVASGSLTFWVGEGTRRNPSTKLRTSEETKQRRNLGNMSL